MDIQTPQTAVLKHPIFNSDGKSELTYYSYFFLVMGSKGTVYPFSQLAYKGSAVYIHCSSLHPPQWLKNGIPLTQDSHYRMLNGSLTVYNVNDQDSGYYTCLGTLDNTLPFLEHSELLVGGKKTCVVF